MPESRAPRKTVESAGSSTAAHAANGQVRRILYVEANEDGTVGGSHQALFELVVNLDRSRFAPIVLFYQDNVFAARLRDRGIEVCLYDAVRAQERRIRQTRSRLRRLPEYAYTILRRLRFLRQYGIDLIHINNSPRIGDDDWLPAARLLGIACVASVRGDASGPVGGWVRRKLFLGFDHYLPVSQYIASSMSRVGVPSERMDLVYDGVDLTSLRRRVQRSRDDVRRELSVPADGLLALMVGNIRHWKGQH
ncbi:MAG: glycosyltransferase, partial [Longimicrobiales bacterium]